MSSFSSQASQPPCPLSWWGQGKGIQSALEGTGSDEDGESPWGIILGVWVLEAPGLTDRTDSGILSWACKEVGKQACTEYVGRSAHAQCLPPSHRPLGGVWVRITSYHPVCFSLAETQLVGAQISPARSLNVSECEGRASGLCAGWGGVICGS